MLGTTSPSSLPSAEDNRLPVNDVRLSCASLDVGAISRLVVDPRCGAVATFTGTTRDNFGGRTVINLEYEAYEEMAEDEMRRLCATVRDKFPDVVHLAIHHRIGVVPVTESSVVIAVSSPHRKTALEACSFAIDELKASVPIWKKELYSDGSSSWKENCECGWSAARSTGPDF